MNPRSEPAPSGTDSLRDLLIARHRRALEIAYPVCGARQADSLARQAAAGGVRPFIWTTEDGQGRALAWLENAAGGVRVHGLLLEPPATPVLSEFLGQLELTEHAPVQWVTDLLPGLNDTVQAEFFPGRHYWHREKVHMERAGQGSLDLVRRPANIRPIAPNDLGAVVGVYVRAYSNRPNEFWTWSGAVPWAEARADVMSHRTPDGQWAPSFLPDASMVWEDHDTVIGAILVEQRTPGVAYIEDLVVEPAFHRRGVGRALLQSALAQLTGTDRMDAALAAIRFGAPHRLYQSMGFREVPRSEARLDGHWVLGDRPVGLS